MKTLSVLTVGLLAVAAAAHADDEPLATDRPDFVESSDVVGRGRMQLETSLAWDRDRQAGVRTRASSTPTLLRIGLGTQWELRLETDGRLTQRTLEAGATVRERGWTDLAVGAKWHQQDGDEERGRPGIGWLLHVDVDSGSGAFRGQGLRPSLRLVAEWELAGGWSVGVMPGLYRNRNEEGRHHIGAIMAAVVGKSLTEQTRVFVELAGQQLASARHGGRVISLDAGVAHLLSRDVQLDLAVARGLTAQTPDFSWTVGLSTRF